MARRGSRDATLGLAAFLLYMAARVRPRGEKWRSRAGMIAGVARRDERFLKDEFQAEMAAMNVFGNAILGSALMTGASVALSKLFARIAFISVASIFAGSMVAATVMFLSAYHRRSWNSGPDVKQRRWPVFMAFILGFMAAIVVLAGPGEQ